MLTLILGRGKSGKTTKLLELVRDSKTSGMAGRILLVPEQLSHQTERALSGLCGDSITYLAEVLSFTRLFSRVCSVSGGGARLSLDQGGRLLTARLALQSVQSRLKVFAAAAGRTEFLGQMVSMIDEFKSYGVTPEQLRAAAESTESYFSQKLSELSWILGAYDAVTAQGAGDPRDRLTRLRRMLMEENYALGRQFFVDGFTDFTAQELGVLDALLRRSGSLTVTLPWDTEEPDSMLFAPARETAAKLIQMAKTAGQPVEVVPADYRRPLTPALLHLEEQLFARPARAFDGGQEAVRLYSAENRLEECRRCAAELKRQAMAGVRWREMAVAAGDTGAYGPLLEQLCREAGVPLYTGTKSPLTAHPAVASVLCALEAATEGMDFETVTAYLRTGCSGVSDDDCDALENYAYTWNIRGAKWQQVWQEHPEGYDGRFTEETEAELDRLNRLRDRAVGPLLRLSGGLKTAGNIRGQVMALYRFLEETNLFGQTQAKVEQQVREGDQEDAQETAQVFNTLMECLQQIVSVLGDAAQPSGELPGLLRLTLTQYRLGTIPAVLDAVQFGGMDALRGAEPRILFILGANEGLMPAPPQGGSLLSERERGILLRELNMELAPDEEGSLERQMLQLYSAFTAPRERLFVSWAETAGGETLQPCFLAEQLRTMFPDAEMGPGEPLEDVLTVQNLTEQFFARRTAGDTPRIILLSRLAEELPELSQSIRRAEQGAEPRSVTVSEFLSRKLFGSPVALTASRLDALGNCPLSFFLRYGLRARPRQEASFDAAEYGTFLHFILEKTVGTMTRENLPLPLESEDSGALVSRFMTPYLETRMQDLGGMTAREQYLYARSSREANWLLRDISRELAVSEFRPRGFELQFGDGTGLGPLVIHSRLGEGHLDGTVDRVDLWHGPAGNCYRIIDYKSGSRKFDYTELSGGVGMQLFLYLFALKNSGIAGETEPLRPAGAMYYPAKRSILSADSPLTGEETEDLRRRKGVRASGLLLGDEAVLEAMEHGVEGKYLPVQRKKNGDLGDFAVTEEQMDLLERFIRRRMAGAVDRIYQGDFGPEPFYRGQSHDPCAWCDYVDACQKDRSFRREYYHPALKAEEFWELIGGEDHG